MHLCLLSFGIRHLSLLTNAVHLINRLPTASLNFSVPYTVLFGQPPSYQQHLKAFGCACFAFLRPYNSHKLEFRSHECLFLGYSNHKGYKCLSPSGKVFISKDVVFNETRFPYTDLFSKPSSHSSSSPSSSFSANIPLAGLASFIHRQTTIQCTSTSSQNNVPNPFSPQDIAPNPSPS